ncbi:MAG: GNAT family N-acetyltransferase, partial [Bacteroidetes bacterium]|nr:GNAT family N-acetyltransferase [Bacteroidota bacterium]
MLVGKSVYLRNIKPADIMILHQWENDPEVQVFGMEKSHVTIGTLRQYISSIQDIYIAKQFRLMIGLKEGHITIGTIDLFD